MKSRKQFKLPRSVLNGAGNLGLDKIDEKDNKSSEPQTPDEYYTEAVNFEISGDRWFSSDLSKSIRFYHRAHKSYLKALELDPIMVDALYNMPRLETEVYLKYIKDDSVVLDDLTNCSEALGDDGPNGLFKNISSLCKSCESSIEILKLSGNESVIGTDLYLNVALCYFEYIETICNDDSLNLEVMDYNSELIGSIKRCMTLFEIVLDKMGTVLQSNEENNENITFESIANVCIDSYKMLSTVYEVLYSIELVESMDMITMDFLSKVDEISRDLMETSLSKENLLDLKISKINERASRILDFENLLAVWNSEDLNNVLEKQLLEASSIRSFLDKFDGLNNFEIPHDIKWRILTLLGNKYRTINDTLKSQISEIEKVSTTSANDLLSGKISLLCSVFIERSDIDLERSLLIVDEAVKNRELLQNNCKNLLKNAIIFSKKTGGIRESVSGKLLRKKRQREAVMRLCLIDAKSQDEWSKIVGEKYVALELKELANIEAYKRLLS